jgi:serine/threonine protein kinase
VSVVPCATPAEVEAAISSVESVRPARSGGQRTVYSFTIDGRRCALFLLKTEPPPAVRWPANASISYGESVLKRVEREIGILRACHCESLVRAVDFEIGRAVIAGEDVIFFAEEWVDGDNTDDILNSSGPLPLTDVAILGWEIAKAIDSLWAINTVHRDVKPENIMQKRPAKSYVLLDLGLALDLNASSLSVLGFPVGTWMYFSPEQVDVSSKRGMDFRSDLFSLGTTMYKLATGVHPFYVPGKSAGSVTSGSSQSVDSRRQGYGGARTPATPPKPCWPRSSWFQNWLACTKRAR